MVLVVADDLLFRSKISTAAKTLGVAIKAATTPDAAVERAKALRPSLVLIDLDGGPTNPFEVLRRFGEDPELKALPTLGFVSHVHADLVHRARQLGIGGVMARGAFAAGLPDILRPHASPAGPAT
jgi:CheY-like chemotaxis protein